jgi:hypothetical protein
MRTFIFLPPVRRPAGGVAVLIQIAEHLSRAGFHAALVRRDIASWMPGESPAEIIDWDDMALAPGDLWLVPEGWVNSLTPGLKAQARCLVYVQNWAYLFSSLPPEVDWRQLEASFLAVSSPVARFVETALGRAVPVLRPGIDLELFHPGTEPAESADRLRVAFMPRKNKALVEQVRALSRAWELDGRGVALEWVPIQDMDASGVARALRSCHLFLASGFPEGCPLPPLEAMASGCLPAGFAGFGGTDYMRSPGDFSPGLVPWWGEREVDWGPNGFWCADNDVLGAALGLAAAARVWREGGQRLWEMRSNCRATAEAYATGVQASAVVRLWRSLRLTWPPVTTAS